MREATLAPLYETVLANLAIIIISVRENRRLLDSCQLSSIAGFFCILCRTNCIDNIQLRYIYDHCDKSRYIRRISGQIEFGLRYTYITNYMTKTEKKYFYRAGI